MIRTLFTPALALAACVTTPALAEEHVWQTGDGFTIRDPGLDLRNAGDRARLLARIDFASARMCRDRGVQRRARRLRQSNDPASAGRSACGMRVAVAAAQRERQSARLAAR